MTRGETGEQRPGGRAWLRCGAGFRREVGDGTLTTGPSWGNVMLEIFADLSTPLVADACLRSDVPLRAAPPIRHTPSGGIFDGAAGLSRSS